MCLFMGLNTLILVFFLAVLAILVLVEVISASDKRVQITIDRNGIQVIGKELKKWSEFCLEDVVTVHEGYKSYSVCLVYDLVNSDTAKNDQGDMGDVHDFQFNVQDMDVSQTRLKYLLKIYRGRSEQNSHTTGRTA